MAHPGSEMQFWAATTETLERIAATLERMNATMERIAIEQTTTAVKLAELAEIQAGGLEFTSAAHMQARRAAREQHEELTDRARAANHA